MSEKIIIKKDEKPFTMISNELIFDPKISDKAKGIYCQFDARPNDWIFYTSEMLSHSMSKKDSFNSGVKELEVAGYIERKQIKEKTGKFSGIEIFVHKNADSSRFNRSGKRPLRSNPKAGKADTDKSATINIDISNNTESTKIPPTPQRGSERDLKSSKNLPQEIEPKENYEKWTEALKNKILEYHQKNGNENGIRFHKDFTVKTTEDFRLIFEVDKYTKEQVLEAVEIIFTNSFYVKSIEKAGVFGKRLRGGVVTHIKAETKKDPLILDGSENLDRVNRETRERQIKTKALDVKRDKDNIFFEKIEKEFRDLSALERKKYYDLLPEDVSTFSKKQCALNQYIAENYPEFQYLVVN